MTAVQDDFTVSALETDLQSFYISYFGRPADVRGIDFWLTSINAGASLATIRAAFQSSGEFLERYSQKDANETITQIYDHLFGRLPDQAGLAFWSDHLRAGRLGLESIIDTILQGAVADDRNTWLGRLDAASRFTTALRREKVDFTLPFDHETGRTWLRQINSDPKTRELALQQTSSLIGRLNGRDPGLISEDTANAMTSMVASLGNQATLRIFYDLQGSGQTRLNKNTISLPINDSILGSLKLAFSRVDALAPGFRLVETTDLAAADIEVHVVASLGGNKSGETSSIIRTTEDSLSGRSKRIYTRVDLLGLTGVDAQYLASHEVLHAFGGEHPFDAADGDSIPSLTTADSMLAYQQSELARSVSYASILTPLDEAMIRFLYA